MKAKAPGGGGGSRKELRSRRDVREETDEVFECRGLLGASLLCTMRPCRYLKAVRFFTLPWGQQCLAAASTTTRTCSQSNSSSCAPAVGAPPG